MNFTNRTDTVAILATVIGSSLLVSGVVYFVGSRIEHHLSSLERNSVSQLSTEPRPVDTSPTDSTAPALSKPSTTPVSAATFATQWEGHYGKIAEEKCWQPHFARYEELPGHLDLSIAVAQDGLPLEFQLVGFKNPDDSPDPALVKAVFDCIKGLLKTTRFPANAQPYKIDGRVNRPNPPKGYVSTRKRPVLPPALAKPSLPNQ